MFPTSLDAKSPGDVGDAAPRSALRTLDFVAKGGCGIGNTHQYEWRCSSFIQTPNTVCAQLRKMLVEVFFSSIFFPSFLFLWLFSFERVAFQVFVIQNSKWLASRWKRIAERVLQFYTIIFSTTPGTHKQTACAPITGDLSNWRLDKFRLECPELTALTAYRFENCGGSSFRALVEGHFAWKFPRKHRQTLENRFLFVW